MRASGLTASPLSLVSGGFDGVDAYLDSVESYSGGGGFADFGSVLPQPLAGHCMALIDDSTALLTGSMRVYYVVLVLIINYRDIHPTGLLVTFEKKKSAITFKCPVGQCT